MVPCIRCGIQETACFLVFVFRVILSCLLLAACGHSLVCDIFCVFVTFSYGVLDQMWYSRNGLLFLLFVFSVILSCLFLTALWSPSRKGLSSWLSCL